MPAFIPIGNAVLPCKDYLCAREGRDVHHALPPDRVRLWLYVCVTNRCNAGCPFCVDGEKGRPAAVADPDRFARVLEKVGGRVSAVSITGGEPLLFPDVVDGIVQAVDQVTALPGRDRPDVAGDASSLAAPNGTDLPSHTPPDRFPLSLRHPLEIDLVTNGTRLDALLGLKSLARLQSVHISRHAVDDEKNRVLMGGGAHIPSEEALARFLRDFPRPHLPAFNCVMQRGGVEGLGDMADYLEMAARVGVDNTAFIGLFPANGYCAAHRIDPRGVDLSRDSRFHVWSGLHDHDLCSCASGDYQARARWVRWYRRCPGDNGGRAPWVRQLVYTADGRLLAGFGGREIQLEG